MSVVNEFFGFPFDDQSPEARETRLNARCPFSGEICDGGGNRLMARISLREDAGLRARFSDSVGSHVDCGICSIRQRDRSWVICPRRIFYPGGEKQDAVARKVVEIAGLEEGQSAQVWREVKMKTESGGKKFNYTFDYIVRGLDGARTPLIVENMTCSTSGGNRAKGTDIQTAFRKSVLRAEDSAPKAPNVNVRQVWARMASQLIVKSEVALSWGGRTLWIVQDLLVDYIKQTTGLAIDQMIATEPHEVNILAAAFDDDGVDGAINEMANTSLYSGPMSSGNADTPCFTDILKAPYSPPVDRLETALARFPSKTYQVSNGILQLSGR